MPIAWDDNGRSDISQAHLTTGLMLSVSWDYSGGRGKTGGYRVVVFGVRLKELAKSLEQGKMLAEAHARRKLEAALACFD